MSEQKTPDVVITIPPQQPTKPLSYNTFSTTIDKTIRQPSIIADINYFTYWRYCWRNLYHSFLFIGKMLQSLSVLFVALSSFYSNFSNISIICGVVALAFQGYSDFALKESNDSTTQLDSLYTSQGLNSVPDTPPDSNDASS